MKTPKAGAPRPNSEKKYELNCSISQFVARSMKLISLQLGNVTTKISFASN